jgi:hypothetical protein
MTGEPAMTYPVTLEIDYVERHNRFTTLLRWLLVFPLQWLFGFYALAMIIGVVLAWIALLFTGRWPVRSYRLCVWVLRYWVRVNAYQALATDRFPPLGGQADDSYPVRLHVREPTQPYNRLKVFVWVLYALPANLAGILMLTFAGFASYGSWFAILFTGKQPRSLFDATFRGLSYWARATALTYLIVDRYPPISEDT